MGAYGRFNYEPYGGPPSSAERSRVLELFREEVNDAVTASAYPHDSTLNMKWRRWRAVTDELVPGSGNAVETTNILALLLRQGYTPDQLRAMFVLAFT